MEKNKVDILSKLIEAINKKILIMFVVAGAFGAYAVSFIKDSEFIMNMIGYLFVVVFLLASFIALRAYVKMNLLIKELERMKDE